MSQQRSYFIQPKSGSDWSSSARLTDQEILSEFDKMNLPTYQSEPLQSDLYQRPTEREYQFPARDINRERQISISIVGQETNVKPLRSEPVEVLSSQITSQQLSSDYSRTSTTQLTSKIINAQDQPADIRESETITVLGQTGVYANKQDTLEWSGHFPLQEYPVNEDANPEIIHKESTEQINYTQEISIRYLKPPPLPPPGEIVVKQEENIVAQQAPPIVVRQQPLLPETRPAIIFREAPPRPPRTLKRVELSIPGKRLPPMPRKVVIERLPLMPQKPQQIIVERWLPYQEQKRKVVFLKAQEQVRVQEKVRNLIIQWQPLKANVTREFKDLGIVQCNPEEYVQRYGDTLVDASQLPSFVRDIQPPSGLTLAVNQPMAKMPQLEGDIHALSLVDEQTLERENLTEYRQYSSSYSSSSFETSKWPSSSRKVNESMSESKLRAYNC